MTYRSRPVTEAIIATLATANLVVGDGEKPDDGGWVGVAGQSDFVGYVVVHPIGTRDIDGTLDEPSDDVWPLHQISAFGASRAQCEQIADTAREAMLGSTLAVTGRRVGRYQPDLLGIITRLDEEQPPLYMSPDRYMAFTTPS